MDESFRGFLHESTSVIKTPVLILLGASGIGKSTCVDVISQEKGIEVQSVSGHDIWDVDAVADYNSLGHMRNNALSISLHDAFLKARNNSENRNDYHSKAYSTSSIEFLLDKPTQKVKSMEFSNNNRGREEKSVKYFLSVCVVNKTHLFFYFMDLIC